MSIEQMNEYEKLKQCLEPLSGTLRVGLYLDLANVWMSEKKNGWSQVTGTIFRTAEEIGIIQTSKAYTAITCGEVCKPGLLRLEREGYQIIPRFVPNTEYGSKKDIDTFLISDVIRDLFLTKLDLIVIASDDSDFIPAFREIKLQNKFGLAIVSNREEAKLVAATANFCIDVPTLNDHVEALSELHTDDTLIGVSASGL